MDRGLPAREAERERGVALVARDGLERLLDDADEDGDVEHREREGTGEDGEAPVEREHKRQHAEQADDDGRQARQGLDRGLGDVGDGALRRVLGEEDRRAERDGERDEQREDEQVERVEELGADAAAGLELLRLLREEAGVDELARAGHEDVADDGGEASDDEGDYGREDDGRGLVLDAGAPDGGGVVGRGGLGLALGRCDGGVLLARGVFASHALRPPSFR